MRGNKKKKKDSKAMLSERIYPHFNFWEILGKGEEKRKIQLQELSPFWSPLGGKGTKKKVDWNGIHNSNQLSWRVRKSISCGNLR